MGRPNLSRETKFSGANGDREMFIFRVQLATSRIGNLTRLIHALAMQYVMTIVCTLYIRKYSSSCGTNYSSSQQLLSEVQC